MVQNVSYFPLMSYEAYNYDKLCRTIISSNSFSVIEININGRYILKPVVPMTKLKLFVDKLFKILVKKNELLYLVHYLYLFLNRLVLIFIFFI